jgi:hypothetical protein
MKVIAGIIQARRHCATELYNLEIASFIFLFKKLFVLECSLSKYTIYSPLVILVCIYGPSYRSLAVTEV